MKKKKNLANLPLDLLLKTAQLAGQNAAASAVAEGRRVAGWEDGQLVETGTEDVFFKRGRLLAKAADRGEPLPDERIVSFEDNCEMDDGPLTETDLKAIRQAAEPLLPKGKVLNKRSLLR